MAEYFEILCGIAVILLGLYYYLTSTYDFWKIRGVPGPRPIPIFGNIKSAMIGKLSLGDYLKEVYDEYKGEPMVGIFARKTPVLLLSDPDLIKNVLIRDFSAFGDRGMPVHEKPEPLSQNLFNLRPSRWRPLRMRLSPVFTSGKLREMFSLIVECSEDLEKYLEKVVAKGEPIECRDLTAKYTTDVIGSCAFGIEMNSLSDEENEFRRLGKTIFQPTLPMMLRLRVKQSFPWLYDILGNILPYTETTKFFTRLIMDTIQHRRNNNIVRNDFINVLMELQDHPEKLANEVMSYEFLAAQAFLFFAGGFETSSTTISHALYEMALNHDMQDRLREEIREEYARNGGDLKYENVKEMKYLDAVFLETLRKYPPGMLLLRNSTASYTFEGTKVTIPENTKLWIPVYAIHRDPSIFPNPDVFDPERFSEGLTNLKHPMNFLAFGDGPRNCIGARFAIYQTKVGLIKILRNFKVDRCEKTIFPYANAPHTFVLTPKGGIYLKISKMES